MNVNGIMFYKMFAHNFIMFYEKEAAVKNSHVITKSTFTMNSAR